MSFETIFIASGSTGITQSPSGKPLTDFSGFLYYISASGGDGEKIIIGDDAQYQNGAAGYVNSGFIDFEYPYNVDLTTLNVSIGTTGPTGTTEISFQYTDDPSITKYPIGATGFPGASDIAITKGTVRIVADKPTIIANNSIPNYNSYQNCQGFYNGGVYTSGNANIFVNTNLYNQRWINTLPVTATKAPSEGLVPEFGSTGSQYNGGGYYGGINDTATYGPFGRSSGGLATDGTNPPGSTGYTILTLIPKDAIVSSEFVGSTLVASSDINAWDSTGATVNNIGVTGLYLYGMAGGGGGGGFVNADNGGGGGGGGVLSFGFTEIPTGATGYYCDIAAGGGGVHTDVSASTAGNMGGASSINFRKPDTSVYEYIECLPGRGGRGAGSLAAGEPSNGDGGMGYYGGGGGYNPFDNYTLGGISFIRIPSYQGYNDNITDYSGSGGDGGGSINSASFGRSASWGPDITDGAFTGGGGGGFWGGCGVLQGAESGYGSNGLTSAYGYASGGGGGGYYSSSVVYAGGGGSGGYVILRKIVSNNYYLITLDSSSTITSIPIAQILPYTGVWCYAEGINTINNANVSMVSNNTCHFLIKEDGLTQINYNKNAVSPVPALTFQFKSLNINNVIYPQVSSFIPADLTKIEDVDTTTTFVFSNTFRYKLFFYR